MGRVYKPGRGLIGSAICACVLGVAGCAAPPPPAPVEASAVEAADLIGPGPSREVYAALDPRSREPIGREVRVDSAPDADGSWTTVIEPEDGPPRRAGHVLAPDGAVLLAWTRSPKDTDPGGPARLYVFDPPLVMFPPVLSPGGVFEHRTGMTERDPRDESRVVLNGEATRRVYLIDEQAEAWPFEREGLGVVGEMEIEVGPATALRRTTQLLGPAGRPIREHVDYTIRVLGLRFKHEQTVFERLDE